MNALLPEQTYFSIGEVSQLTGLQAYVIRYWESQFGTLRPPRRDSGQRKFTRKEIDTILKIKDLLHEKRFTIAGAKRHIQRESRQVATQLQAVIPNSPESPNTTMDTLRIIRRELEEALRVLKSVA